MAVFVLRDTVAVTIPTVERRDFSTVPEQLEHVIPSMRRVRRLVAFEGGGGMVGGAFFTLLALLVFLLLMVLILLSVISLSLSCELTNSCIKGDFVIFESAVDFISIESEEKVTFD